MGRMMVERRDKVKKWRFALACGVGARRAVPVYLTPDPSPTRRGEMESKAPPRVGEGFGVGSPSPTRRGEKESKAPPRVGEGFGVGLGVGVCRS